MNNLDIDPRTVRLMPGYCSVEINNEARMGNIITPDGVPQSNNTGYLLNVARDPETQKPLVNLPKGTQVGDIVFFQSRPIAHRSVAFQGQFDYCDVIKDSEIKGFVRNGIFFPVGRKLLVYRQNQEFVNPGGQIIVPGAQPTVDQTHWCVYVRRGLPVLEDIKLSAADRKKVGKRTVRRLQEFRILDSQFVPGVRLKLAKWREDIMEVTLPNGKFGLIIDEEDVAGYEPLVEEVE